MALTQPRSMVLQYVKNVILMGPQANILYNGRISEAELYFSQFELSNQNDYSDSDYLLDVVNDEMNESFTRLVELTIFKWSE